MKDKVDLEARFYVRLEDETELQFQLDVSALDMYTQLDEPPNLQQRLINSNNRRLRGLE